MSEAIVNVAVLDTTMRDGAQSLPGKNQFPDHSKVAIADNIARLGVGIIEAGFPKTEGDAEEVQQVAETVGTTCYKVAQWEDSEAARKVKRPPVITGLCRATQKDIDVTWEAVSHADRPRIHTFVSTDERHMKAKFPDMSPKQVRRLGRDAVQYAREITNGHADATVEFSAEAASTTDWRYLERVIKDAIYAGADVINLPDTVGQRSPSQMKTFYMEAIEWIMSQNSDVIISAHNHNDIDMATANTLSLIEAAAEQADIFGAPVNIQLETTICGLGERAGNADVFPVEASLFKFAEEMPAKVRWEFNPKKSVRIARNVMAYAGFEIPRQSPIVGPDTNVHRSGIHSDGIIKGGYKIYTPHDPTFWGHPFSARHEDGKYQGAKGRAASKRR